MVTTTARKNSHLMAIRCAEELDVALTSLAELCLLSKGEMLRELMTFYRNHALAQDLVKQRIDSKLAKFDEAMMAQQKQCNEAVGGGSEGS